MLCKRQSNSGCRLLVGLLDVKCVANIIVNVITMQEIQIRKDVYKISEYNKVANIIGKMLPQFQRFVANIIANAQLRGQSK